MFLFCCDKNIFTVFYFELAARKIYSVRHKTEFLFYLRNKTEDGNAAKNI